MMPVPANLAAALADRYRIERELGEGGMATVYLAEDLRHRRRVAMKVVHPDLAAVIGSERFLREIELTASLQHPHILPLFDSGAADGQLFYVMPFVEGETLRARLDRERQLPVEDALRIAREVAGALDHAHARGIVHRDVKPENILLQDGLALVADFGIALAVQQSGGTRMTQTGMSMGTAQYMSPEQAMGERALDARADVYALAAVTYEMLAGEPPFTGANAQAIVAKVLTSPAPSVRAARESVPAAVDAALARALAKLPADRYASPGAMVQAFTAPVAAIEGANGGQRRGRGRPAWLLAGGGAAGMAAGALLALGWRGRGADASPSAAPIVRVEIPEPAGVRRSTTTLGDLVPNGSGMVQIGDGSGGHGLFVQPFTDSVARFLPFPEAGVGTVPMPDGSGFLTYAFTRTGLSRLNLVPANGGPIRPLTDSVRFGLMLDEQGRVYGSHHASGALVRVAPDGQTVTVLATPDPAKGEMAYRLPSRIGTDALLVHIRYLDDRPPQVGVLASGATTVRPLTAGGSARRLAPGIMVFAGENGIIRAARLDERRLILKGTSVPVWRDPAIPGYQIISVSTDGSLLYPRQLFGGWSVLRAGRGAAVPVFSGTGAPPEGIAASGDGARFALELPEALEVRDMRGGTRRIAVGAATRLQQWLPGGDRLLLIQRASRVGDATARLGIQANSFTPGRLLAVGGDLADAPTPYTPPGGGADSGTIAAAVGASGWVEERRAAGLRFHGATGVVPLAVSGGAYPAVSPDGALVAFEGRGETGDTEILVAALPPRTGRWEVGPGSRPRWSADGRWLYFAGPLRPYSALPSAVSRVAVSTGNGFAAGPTERVADPPANATLVWTVGPRDGLVYWVTSVQRTQPVLVTGFARLADSLLTAAGIPR